MEGLSDELLSIINEQDFCFTPGEMRIVEKAAARFSAYEDIGMEPEEIMALQASFEAIRDDAMPLLRAKIEDRLVILPCKPDEIFYQWKSGNDGPSVSRFEGVEISEDGKITYPMKRWGESFSLDDFGKSIFLSHSEARAAIKMKD